MPAARDESRKGFSRVFFFFQAKITINHCVRNWKFICTQVNVRAQSPANLCISIKTFDPNCSTTKFPAYLVSFQCPKTGQQLYGEEKTNRRKKTEGSYLETITSLQSQICNIFFVVVFVYVKFSNTKKNSCEIDFDSCYVVSIKINI